ncbi:zinc knuckle domain-containing protein [Pochonia chlamydosporia 170]|uniref:Zinc knuckle domain-containing protein n=1 Tax=Pochonia chlamydosporia 170 TaxID=1380566 RepID=A0A219APE8_METCM|nr:zinc knuckle domain-containing protein [Pochonia chlamydosporia 170]OWT42696.1 zinc knuckle domain-containing protein [Pochonia chlamydosporia 170]
MLTKLKTLTSLARHYSYECKASSQERPYVSRPSRSQQLRNPKLLPKLTSDTPNPLEKKAGVADEVLQKREAERAKQEARDDSENESLPPSPKRRRSASSASVSTISTDASRRSRSPARDSRSPPPQRRRRSPDIDEEQGRQSVERSLSRSPPPVKRAGRSESRDSHSPRHAPQERRYRDREDVGDAESRPRRSRPNSPPRHDAQEQRRRVSYASQSPEPDERRPPRGYDHRARDRRNNHERRRDTGRPRPRSLSPFSRRLAMTQSMNRGGR